MLICNHLLFLCRKVNYVERSFRINFRRASVSTRCMDEVNFQPERFGNVLYDERRQTSQSVPATWLVIAELFTCQRVWMWLLFETPWLQWQLTRFTTRQCQPFFIQIRPDFKENIEMSSQKLFLQDASYSYSAMVLRPNNLLMYTRLNTDTFGHNNHVVKSTRFENLRYFVGSQVNGQSN